MIVFECILFGVSGAARVEKEASEEEAGSYADFGAVPELFGYSILT